MMRIGIMGAGSIGCYVGGRLAAGGADVVLVGRQALADELALHGMVLTDCEGRTDKLKPGALSVSTGVTSLADVDMVLVTVKSQDTPKAAAELAPVIKANCVVVSLQNGVRNVSVLQNALAASAASAPRVLAGMVPYNVLRLPGGRFHRGTSGALVVEKTPDGAEQGFVQACSSAGLALEAVSNVAAVQWGKLLFNLNNAVNALAGLPLREELAQRAYRRVWAALMEEALVVYAAAGIHPKLAIKAPAYLVPKVLRLPTFLFSSVAKTMLAVDPQARSSMWEDFARRRPTEVDFLNGEIVALAQRLGLTAPRNAAVVSLVREAEKAGLGSPQLAAAAIWASLHVR